MADPYQALYRRYRSKRFGEQRGQDHVMRALRTAVQEDRVGHAYLFSGPRGTGKTSTARAGNERETGPVGSRLVTPTVRRRRREGREPA